VAAVGPSERSALVRRIRSVHGLGASALVMMKSKTPLSALDASPKSHNIRTFTNDSSR